MKVSVFLAALCIFGYFANAEAGGGSSNLPSILGNYGIGSIGDLSGLLGKHGIPNFGGICQKFGISGLGDLGKLPGGNSSISLILLLVVLSGGLGGNGHKLPIPNGFLGGLLGTVGGLLGSILGITPVGPNPFGI